MSVQDLIAEMQTKADVVLHSEPWRALSDSQRTWVMEFGASGNAQAATRVAYPAASEKQIVPMSDAIRQFPRIKAALEFWQNSVVEQSV